MRLALAAALALAALGGGCRSEPAPTFVQHRAVARLAAGAGSVPSPLAATVVEHVQQVLDEKAAAVDLDVEVERTIDGPEAHPQIRVVVWQASIRPRVPSVDFAPFDVSVTRSVVDPTVEIVDSVAIELLATRTAALLRSRLGDGSDLVALLGAEDASSRLFALREVERRRHAAARETVLAGLNAERPLEFVAAVGALLAIGSEADAEAIIDALPLRDADLVLAVLPALHRLGGPAVTGLLQTLASAHDSDEVRSRARELLGGR